MMFGLIGVLAQIIIQEIQVATTLLINGDSATLGSQDFDDISGFLHTVTVTGDDPVVVPIVPPTTNFIRRLQSTNNDNYITITNATGETVTDFGTGDFTFRFWLYHFVGSATTEDLATIIDNRPNGSSPTGWFCIGINADTKQLEFHCADFVLTSIKVTPYVWHFCQITRDDGVTTLYVDAVEDDSDTHTSIIDDFDSLRIFRNAYSGSTTYPPFLGYIDDLAIDDEVISVEIPTAPLLPVIPDPFASDVVLYLKGNGVNNSTSIIDSSPSAKTVTLYGNVKISTDHFKYGGSSILFDGNGDYLSLASSSDWAFGSADFTVEGWLKINALLFESGVYRTVFISNYQDANTGWYLQVRGSNTSTATTLVFGRGNTDLISASISNILGSFAHVAVSREGNQLRLFLNGILLNTVTNSTNFADNFTLFIGLLSASSGLTLWDYNGNIDSGRITLACRYTADFDPEVDTYMN